MSVSTEPWSPRFSNVARAVADSARQLGLEAPGFRSPPHVPGADRTLRRFADGRCVVAVRAKGRPFDDVVNDLIDGVLAANAVAPEKAADVRATIRRSINR